MSQPINDGGPAFPHKRQIRCNGEVIDSEMEPGMTLRDYFAAAALQGFCANQRWNPIESIHFANLAEDAFIAADAMIRAREVKP